MKPPPAKISGYLMVRQGVALDYCFVEAINSLLPVCDEIVVSDSDSLDDTRDILMGMAQQHPQIRILNKPWTDPVGRPTWWVEWINWTREHLQHPWQLQLDADEVLDPQSYPYIKEAVATNQCLWFKRLNFWRDAQHIAPSGDGGIGIGDGVARFGPTRLWMPSDEPLTPEPEIRQLAGRRHIPGVQIYHYGFLRRNDAFVAKARACLRAWFNTTDERIERAAREGKPWLDNVTFDKPLMEWPRRHPEVAHAWLLDRGYKVES